MAAAKVMVDGLILKTLLAFSPNLYDTIALGRFGVNPK
jgi:hypothetical protein